MDLPMSNAEIVASYKNAAYPDKQIAVLADLNVCKKSDIKRILQDAGALVTDGAKETVVLADEPTGFEKVERGCDAERKRSEAASIPQKKKLGQWDKRLARRLYDEGKSDGQIATAVGISTGAVLFWRRSQNLPANSRKGRHAESKPLENDSVKLESETEENVNDLKEMTEKAEYESPKLNDSAHAIADAILPRKHGMTINQDFENAVKLMEAEHELKVAKKTVEDQQRSLMAAHNRYQQIEKKLRAAEEAAASNPDLMHAVELTFDLLNKMWERI